MWAVGEVWHECSVFAVANDSNTSATPGTTAQCILVLQLQMVDSETMKLLEDMMLALCANIYKNRHKSLFTIKKLLLSKTLMV